MAYVTAEARQELLDTIARATDEIGAALGVLGEAYEQLDEQTGDRLEEALFKPVQGAYGRARRTHSEFAGRYDLPTRTFAPATPATARPACASRSTTRSTPPPRPTTSSPTCRTR